jgi:hypothetical protein
MSKPALFAPLRGGGFDLRNWMKEMDLGSLVILYFKIFAATLALGTFGGFCEYLYCKISRVKYMTFPLCVVWDDGGMKRPNWLLRVLFVASVLSMLVLILYVLKSQRI